MARTFARAYFYAVFIALLVFAAVGLGALVALLLNLTPLRGANPAPTGAEVTQSLVFVGVTWVIAGALGGLHYWLIRRDLRADPTASGGAIRAFFLNVAEGVAILNGVPAAAFAITNLGGGYPSGAIGPIAYAIAALAIAGVLELERRRTAAAPGRPLLFQRLHLYGVGLILAFIGAWFWLPALQASVYDLLAAIRLVPACGAGSPYGPCYGPNVASLWGAALVVALAWAGYWLLARRADADSRSALRVVIQALGFAYGLIVALVGVYGLLRLLLLALLRGPASWEDLASGYAPAALLFGLLVGAVYAAWLRGERAASALGPAATDLTLEAVAAVILAAPFWWGVGLLVLRALDALARAAPGAERWAQALALALTGVAYIPISLALRRLTLASGIASPRRAFVLALLAGGVVAGAVGAAVLLYALGTALLGAPLGDWGGVARGGAAALLAGAALVGLYAWAGAREGLLALPAARPAPSAAPAADGADAGVAVVVDELLAGKITRDEAVRRLVALASSRAAPAAGEPPHDAPRGA